MTVRFESQAEPIPGYRLIERLGSGGFGEVWKAEAPGGIFKAIKIVFGDINSEDRDIVRFAEQELKALKRVKQVRHPYLLALDRYDIVEGRLLITMELADCNLWDRFREYRKRGQTGIPRPELLQYMAESAEVLDLMNDRFQLQHLDIKPQNLFLLYNHVKVADFGQVKDLEGMAAQVTGGITPVYAAPETFDGIISRFCDQYSLACVYQELLTGQRPFEGATMQQLLMQHLQMPPNLSPSPPADRPALARALAKKPEDRFPSCAALVAALRDGTEANLRVGLPPAQSSALTNALARSATSADPAAVSDRIEVRLDSSGILLRPSPEARSELPPALLPPPPPPPPPLPPPVYSPPSDSGTGYYSAPPSSGVYETASHWPTEPLPEDDGGMDSAPLISTAPPEAIGPGTIQPTLVIGAGYTGLRVLQRFRKQLEDRFGPPGRLPVVRTLYIDTDPDALSAAVADPAPGLVRLRPEDVIAARLNRAQHYLKPRLSGRSLIEGWFDSQLLYRLPRNPVTMGVRVFGRLAFCDHYRAVIQKVQSELEACLDTAAITDSLAATGMALRSNRPRVYIAAGLGGGTGSGMFLDLAYTVRARLKRLGYPDPEIIGILHVPPDGEQHPQTLANVYAALTELHHYGRAETLFSANYDDRPSLLRDTAPPFRQVYLLPGLPGGLVNPATPPAGGNAPSANLSRGSISMSGVMRNSSMNPRLSGAWNPTRSGGSGVSVTPATPDIPPADRDPCTLGAEVIRLDLFSGVGRIIDEAMPAPATDGTLSDIRTLGAVRFTWPRGDVIARTGRVIAHSLIHHWVTPSPDHIRAMIPNWIGERWSALGLDPGHLEAQFRQVVQRTAQCNIDTTITALIEPLIPKGWLARLPDPNRVSVVVDQIRRLIGRPSTTSSPTHQTEVETALAAYADRVADVAATDAAQLFLELFEQPEFRPAGTEEAIRQFLAMLDQTSEIFSNQTITLEHTGGAAFDLLVGYAHYQRGMRKPSTSEFADALRHFPDAQHHAVITRAQVHVYQRVREALIKLLNQVETCRHRAEGLLPLLATDKSIAPHLPTQRELFLLECQSVSESTKRFVEVLNDDDLMTIDRHIQERLQHRHGGLFHACLNATDGLGAVLDIVQDATRSYLDERLGEVDFAGMMWQRYGTPDAIGREIARAYQEAEPTLIGPGPWTRNEIGVFIGPTGLGGDPIREVAAAVLPPTILADETRDEVVLVREYPAVPLSALAQFGPAWVAAYRAAYDIQQTTAHTRLDVIRWVDVDSV